MSNIGQSIIDTPQEEALAAMPTLEPDVPLTPEEIAEAEEAAALWSATTTLKPFLWEVNIVLNSVRYSGLMLSKEEPDHRKAAALIATVYSLGTTGAADLITAIAGGRATVLSHRPTIHDEESINANHIPF